MKTLLSLILFIFILVGCTTEKKVPNYRVTPNGFEIWRYTKVGEPKKDILSNGDTLVTIGDGIYIIKKSCTDCHEFENGRVLTSDPPTKQCIYCGQYFNYDEEVTSKCPKR